MTKQTRNMQVFSFCQLYSNRLHYLFLDFTILNQYLSITDLPSDTKLTDLSKLADLDMNKLPHPEESGDRCIQEFLINCKSMPLVRRGLTPSLLFILQRSK